MFINPLFLQAVNVTDSMSQSKTPKLNASQYLFSDIIKVSVNRDDAQGIPAAVPQTADTSGQSAFQNLLSPAESLNSKKAAGTADINAIVKFLTSKNSVPGLLNASAMDKNGVSANSFFTAGSAVSAGKLTTGISAAAGDPENSLSGIPGTSFMQELPLSGSAEAPFSVTISLNENEIRDLLEKITGSGTTEVDLDVNVISPDGNIYKLNELIGYTAGLIQPNILAGANASVLSDSAAQNPLMEAPDALTAALNPEAQVLTPKTSVPTASAPTASAPTASAPTASASTASSAMPAASISDAAESYSASQTYASGLTGREQAAEQLVSQDQVPAENQSNSQTGGQTAAQPMTSSSGSENNVYSASALSSEQLIGESSAPEAAPAAKAIKAEAGKENTTYNSEKTRTADNKNTPAADTPSAQRQNTENVQDTVNLQAKNGIKLSPEAMQQQGKVVIEQVAENYTPAKTTSAPTDMNSEVPFSGTVIETFSSAGDIGKTSVSAFAEDNKIKVGVMTGETLKNAGIKESGIKESGFKESVISSEAGISDSSSMAAEKNALSENITSTEQAVSRQTVSSAFVSPAPSAARDTAVDKTVDMLKTGSLLHITGNNGKELNVSIKDNADGNKAEGSNLAGYGEVSEKDVELLSGLDKFQGRNGLKISAALEARPETKPAADAAEPAVKEIQMQAARSEGADKQAFTAQGEPANKEAALKETDNKEVFEKESFTGETKSKAAETENAGLREERKTGPYAGEHAAQRDNASQSERMLRNDAMQSGGFKNLSGRIKEFQDNAVKMKSGEVKQVHETSQKPKPAESAGPVKEEAAAQDIKPANQPAKETSPGEGEEQAGRQQQSSQSEQQHRKTSDGFVIANADNTIKTQDLQVKAKPEVPGSSVMKHVKDVEVIKEISRFIQQSEKGSLVLRVDPEHLGSIKIALETIDNMMHAKIEVENAAARKLVENNLNHLQSSLNQNGVQLSSLNVSLAEYSQKGQAQQERPGQRKRGQSFSDSMQNEEANPAGEKDLGYNTYEYLA